MSPLRVTPRDKGNDSRRPSCARRTAGAGLINASRLIFLNCSFLLFPRPYPSVILPYRRRRRRYRRRYRCCRRRYRRR